MRKIFLSKDLKKIFIKLSLAYLLIIFASCFILDANDINSAKKKKDYFLVTSAFSYFPGIPIFQSKELINWHQIGLKQIHKSQLTILGQQSSGSILLIAINNFPHNQTCHTIVTNSPDLFSSWYKPLWLKEVVGCDSSFIFEQDVSAKLLI
jgi:xylan 1,4-beta-xylosidase